MKRVRTSSNSGQTTPRRPTAGKALKQQLATTRERKAPAKALARLVKRLASIATSVKQPGRPGLSALAPPLRDNRVDKALHGGTTFFEIVEASRREDDAGRSTGMSRAQQLTAEDQATAQDLAAELKRGAERLDPPLSLASSLYMREVRIRVTGAVWQLHDELACQPARDLDPGSASNIDPAERMCGAGMRTMSGMGV